MNIHLIRLSRALYIPGYLSFLVGIWLLYCQHDRAHAALIGIFGTMLGIIALCVAIKAHGGIDFGDFKRADP